MALDIKEEPEIRDTHESISKPPIKAMIVGHICGGVDSEKNQRTISEL